MSDHISKAVIIAGVQIDSGTAVNTILNEARTHQLCIVGVDGGTDVALAHDLTPSFVIGDMDSISPYVLATIEAQRIEIIRHPSEKDETDLELALIEVVQRGATWIRILGAIGHRLDQTLANIYLLGLPVLEGIDVKLVTAEQTTWLIGSGTHQLMGQIDDTISLIPFNDDTQGITTKGLKYPLKDETLTLGPARGVSNVIVSPRPTITIKHGQLLVVHTVGRA